VKRLFTRFAISCTVAVLSLVFQLGAPAALTVINNSPDQGDEPNLVGTNPFPNNLNPSVLATLYGENNLTRIDDSLDIAFQQTGSVATVKAVARFNNPTIQESFRYLNLDTNVARTALTIHQTFITTGFKSPVGYNPATDGSGLISLADSGPIFEVRVAGASNPAKNFSGQDKMVTFRISGADGHPSNQIGNYVLAWEYFDNDDLDYQDVVFEIGGVVPTSVPEPCGLLLGMLALSWSMPMRRRR
jgi:hypothetical protein